MSECVCVCTSTSFLVTSKPEGIFFFAIMSAKVTPPSGVGRGGAAADAGGGVLADAAGGVLAGAGAAAGVRAGSSSASDIYMRLCVYR